MKTYLYPLDPFQVGFSKQGIVEAIIVTIFGNAGICLNDYSSSALFAHIDNGTLSGLSIAFAASHYYHLQPTMWKTGR